MGYLAKVAVGTKLNPVGSFLEVKKSKPEKVCSFPVRSVNLRLQFRRIPSFSAMYGTTCRGNLPSSKVYRHGSGPGGRQREGGDAPF